MRFLTISRVSLIAHEGTGSEIVATRGEVLICVAEREVQNELKVAEECQPEDAMSSIDGERDPPDIEILYCTLMDDGALPEGFLASFSSPQGLIQSACGRQYRQAAILTNMEVVEW